MLCLDLDWLPIRSLAMLCLANGLERRSPPRRYPSASEIRRRVPSRGANKLRTQATHGVT